MLELLSKMPSDLPFNDQIVEFFTTQEEDTVCLHVTHDSLDGYACRIILKAMYDAQDKHSKVELLPLTYIGLLKSKLDVYFDELVEKSKFECTRVMMLVTGICDIEHEMLSQYREGKYEGKIDLTYIYIDAHPSKQISHTTPDGDIFYTSAENKVISTSSLVYGIFHQIAPFQNSNIERNIVAFVNCVASYATNHWGKWYVPFNEIPPEISLQLLYSGFRNTDIKYVDKFCNAMAMFIYDFVHTDYSDKLAIESWAHSIIVTEYESLIRNYKDRFLSNIEMMDRLIISVDNEDGTHTYESNFVGKNIVNLKAAGYNYSGKLGMMVREYLGDNPEVDMVIFADGLGKGTVNIFTMDESIDTTGSVKCGPDDAAIPAKTLRVRRVMKYD